MRFSGKQEVQVVDRFLNKNAGAEPILNGLTALPSPEDLNVKDSVVNKGKRRDAICVRNAWKKYGKGDKATQVLSDLTLSVKEGTIYTLLGSSGCGKTTLLSCIVGMTNLDKGECRVFGLKPGTAGCGVPGKKIGYMPQEIALYREFTIREAMLYFGKIHGMSTSQIEDRMAFLIRFLHLPPSHRFIRSLSGGQQRRVSFAVALLHEPKILILDEPTVGVDPLLRKSIWKHLSELVETGKTTVVITTHYIEEANEAHRIGLMRNGRLLAEDSPEQLLEKYECGKLEDVFLKLCERDAVITNDFGSIRSSDTTLRSDGSTTDAENAHNDDATESSSLDTEITSDDNNTLAMYNETSRVQNGIVNPSFASSAEQLIDEGLSATTPSGPVLVKEDLKVQSFLRNELEMFEKDEAPGICGKLSNFDPLGYWNKMNALVSKDFLCMWRNIGFVCFIFFLPAVQAVLFCLAIGGEPTHLPLGVINNEVLDDSHCQVLPGCSTKNMSCSFLKRIPEETINLKAYRDENEAIYEVKEGNSWGYLVIPSNFSDVMIQKGVAGSVGEALGEDSFQGMHVKLSLDQTSQQISYTIQHTLAQAFQKFTSNLLFDCGLNDTIELPPTSVAEPIYGSSNASFREFMAPGIILSIIFFMSVALTGSAFITERKEGMLNRSLVAGVTTGQIIFAHMITQYIIMAGQTVLVLVVMVWIFNVGISGSITVAVALTLLQGTCGMAYGFLISCVCTEERNAIQMALGSFYPNLLLSGVVWPLESMPLLVRQIAIFLPQTVPCEAMRSIFSRAWPITHPKVWPAFAVSLGWSVVFWMIALLLASRRRN